MHMALQTSAVKTMAGNANASLMLSEEIVIAAHQAITISLIVSNVNVDYTNNVMKDQGNAIAQDMLKENSVINVFHMLMAMIR